MAQAIVKVYDNLSVAESARDQLLASGFSLDDVELTTLYDEAGPMEGNFYVGSGGAASKGLSGLLSTGGGVNETIYGPDYSQPQQYSSFVLKVDLQDDTQRDRATAVLDQFASTDPDKKS